MAGRADNTLRVFVDKSVLEVFVGEHTILSTRVYPVAGDAAARVGTFSSGGGCAVSALSSWQMEDVYAGLVQPAGEPPPRKTDDDRQFGRMRLSAGLLAAPLTPSASASADALATACTRYTCQQRNCPPGCGNDNSCYCSGDTNGPGSCKWSQCDGLYCNKDSQCQSGRCYNHACLSHAPPPAPPPRCLPTLRAVCDGARCQGEFACATCSGTHASVLHAANCSETTMQAFCNNQTQGPCGALGGGLCAESKAQGPFHCALCVGAANATGKLDPSCTIAAAEAFCGARPDPPPPPPAAKTPEVDGEA